MLSKKEIRKVKRMLADHRGQFGTVIFTKKDGSLRKMVFRQGVKQGSTPLRGGEWANGTAGKASDHKLALVTDMAKERAGEHSRRSIPLDRIRYLRFGEEIFGTTVGE